MNDVMNKRYTDTQDGKKTDITYVDSQLAGKLDRTISSDLDMGGKKIVNLATPKPYENSAAVNVSYFNTQINESNTNLYTRLTSDYKTYVNKSNVTSSTSKKDVFSLT